MFQLILLSGFFIGKFYNPYFKICLYDVPICKSSAPVWIPFVQAMLRFLMFCFPTEDTSSYKYNKYHLSSKYGTNWVFKYPDMSHSTWTSRSAQVFVTWWSVFCMSPYPTDISLMIILDRKSSFFAFFCRNRTLSPFFYFVVKIDWWMGSERKCSYLTDINLPLKSIELFQVRNIENVWFSSFIFLIKKLNSGFMRGLENSFLF